MSVLENFKNIPRSPYGGRQGSNVIFFLLQICNKVPREKKRGGLLPVGGATGPHLFFFSRDFVANLKKKNI